MEKEFTKISTELAKYSGIEKSTSSSQTAAPSVEIADQHIDNILLQLGKTKK